MQRFVLILALIIVLVMFALQGFQPRYTFPSAVVGTQETEENSAATPQQAIDDIYINVSVMGVEDATPERLESEFGIDPLIYTGLWGKYSDGRFGAADVIVIQPRNGMEKEVREALQNIKLSRMNLFKNYDIYNSYSLAEEGSIIERGDYIMLLMIENKEAVIDILYSNIPR